MRVWGVITSRGKLAWLQVFRNLSSHASKNTKVSGTYMHSGTKVARYSAGANCLLGGFWVLKAGVHDRIPSDSCESRFNITALKRPTTVQQCPMILQNTLHRLACLCPTSDTKPNNKSDYETSRLVSKVSLTLGRALPSSPPSSTSPASFNWSRRRTCLLFSGHL